MLSTTVVILRSVTEMILSAISCGGSPLKVQMTLTTGISMLGKMSVGVRTIARVPRRKKRDNSTTMVCGSFSASLTIHMIHCPIFPSGLAGLHQPNRTYGRCFGVFASSVEINGLAAGGTATVPDRTISLAGIFLPYTPRLWTL